MMRLTVALTLMAAPAVAQTVTVEIEGRRTELSAADLAALPHDTVTARIHDQPGILFSGVRVDRILKRAGYPIDSLRGPRLAHYLLAEASDGYRVVFSLAELAPDIGGRAVLLVDRANGKPLSAAEGPYRLLVPHESRPSRWARQIVSLRILSAPASARQ